MADPGLPVSSLPAVQRIAESHLQTISNLGENQASEEEDELGELRELGYPREDDEEEEDEDEEEDEEEDSQAEVLKGSRGTGKLKGLPSVCGFCYCGSGMARPEVSSDVLLRPPLETWHHLALVNPSPD